MCKGEHAKLLDDIVSTKGSEIAVADEFGSTTWSQFDERVRRLINGLKDHGVGPETPSQ